MVARLRTGLASATLLMAALALPAAAHAAGAVEAPGVIATEARIAIAVSSDHTTTWSSLRVDGVAGPLAMVVPTLDGSALDYASRAFFDALEDATAPRVLPPHGQPAACPSATPAPVLSVESDPLGLVPLPPLEVAVLASVDDVKTWATAHGLSVEPALATALAAFGPSYRFVVVRFDAPGGPAITKTLRAVSPTADPVLPLLLSSAPSQDLAVTTWEIGTGRARLVGTEVAITTDNLTFGVANATSNYRSLVDAILSDPERHVVESSGHGLLTTSTSLFNGQASVDSVIDAYYARAAKAGDATADPAQCTFQAATALSQGTAVAHACPRADLGGAGTIANCTEAPTPGEIDPAELRCGGVADDLAVALSGLVAKNAWITRSVLRIGTGKSGTNLTVGFTGDPAVNGVLDAAAIDQTGCGGGKPSTGSAGSSGSGTMGSPSPTMKQVPVYRHEGCSAGGSYNLIGYNDVSSDSSTTAYYDDSTDGCGSSTLSSGYDTAPADSCASDSSSGSSSSGCDSSAPTDTTSTDACSSGSSSDSCNSGSSSDSCSGGSGSSDNCNCSMPSARHKRGLGLRLSPLVYGAVLLLTPLRRRFRRRRRTSRS